MICVSLINIRELKERRRLRQREKNSNRFRLAKQQLSTCTTLFCTFLCRHCTTTTWKCLISRFVGDVNLIQRLSFSFPEVWQVWDILLEFNSRKNWQHLTHWASRWDKRDKVLSRTTSLFKWRLRRRRRRCFLSSLIGSLAQWHKRHSFERECWE